jgi:hypothetical protein
MTPTHSKRQIEPLELHELERIYFWLNRQRLVERPHLSEASLRDLEECEARVQKLMLASRPGGSTHA